MYILNNDRLFQLSHITEIWFDDYGVYCRYLGDEGVHLLVGHGYDTYEDNKRAFERITDWIVTNSLADKGIDSYKYKAIFTMPDY